MRVLLDENVDRRLSRLIDPVHEVVTVAERGWSGMRNSDLLGMAEQEFDVLVTMDQNLQHQQNLSAYDLAVVVIKARTNRREDVEPAMPKVNRVLEQAKPGMLTEVTA